MAVLESSSDAGVPPILSGMSQPPTRSEIAFEARARALRGHFKTAEVRGPGGESFTVECDEGPALGGEGRAPTPLMYLAAALAF
jgi:hypothetical protein